MLTILSRQLMTDSGFAALRLRTRVSRYVRHQHVRVPYTAKLNIEKLTDSG